MRARVDGNLVNLSDEITLDGNVAHDVDVVIDRITIEPQSQSRIADSLNQALQLQPGGLYHPGCRERRGAVIFDARLLPHVGLILHIAGTS